MGVQNAPLEILHDIGAQLALRDVKSFSLTSKHCRAGLVPPLFRTVWLDPVPGPDTPEVEGYNARVVDELVKTGCVQHIRCLIVGHRAVDYTDGGSVYFHKRTTYRLMTDKDSEDHFWQPLADLLQHLKGLNDFIYSLPYQLSPCLLDALEHIGPACRLHLRSFHLNSLSRPAMATEPIVMHPYEVRLASSPCLYSITASYWPTDFRGDHDYTREAVLDMLGGLAPNLREVTMSRMHLQGSDPRTGGLSPLRRAWRGDEFRSASIKTSRKAALTRLELQAFELEWSLQDYISRVDFSTLLTLKLSNVLGEIGLSILRDTPLPSLIYLDIDLPNEYNTMERFHVVTEFLASLPSLRDLTLRGSYQELGLRDIVSECGRRLRTLHLLPRTPFLLSDSLQLVSTIAGRMPYLEDLRIPLTRTKGDVRELELYSTLGRLSELRKLGIDLECVRIPAPVRDKGLAEYGHAHAVAGRIVPDSTTEDEVRDILLNSKVDTELAAAIFKTISSAKSEGAAPIERIEVRAPYSYITHSFPQT